MAGARHGAVQHLPPPCTASPPTNPTRELPTQTPPDAPPHPRVKIEAPTEMGETMRIDAQRSMIFMAEELGRRLGRPQLIKTAHFLAEDWGPPMTFTPEEVKDHHS